MGGAKKKSLAQAEKQQQLQTQKQEKTERKKPTKTVEKKTSGIDIPNVRDKEFVAELSKMKAITPYAVATKHNLKLSIAKDLLEALEKEGIVQRIAGNSSLKIYKFGSSLG